MNQHLHVARYTAITAILLATVFAHAQASDATSPSPRSGDQHRAASRVAPPAAKDLPVSAVTGESWLNHLNRQFGDSSMGKTGRLGPPPAASGEEATEGQPGQLVACSTRSATLHGADLYRLNCQGCHGEAGQGAPPEINSVINPVRATSVAVVMERMKKMGMDMSRADATQLAQQAQAALLTRLHNGGKDMPAFPQLNEVEIRSIIAYLRQLAGIPGAEKEQIAVTESPIRVGELIVKSTCHTCHDAAGPNPTPQQLLKGAIPPLATLTARKDQSGLIQKITQGAPVVMGTPPTPTRGRMPVFYYLSSEEAADVHLYLTQYPSSELSILDSVATTLPPLQAPDATVQAGMVPRQQTPPSNRESEPPQSISRAEPPYLVLFAAMGLFAAILMAGGLGFTVWEFRRLSPNNKRHVLSVASAGNATSAVQQVVAMKRIPCRAVSVRGKGRTSEPPVTEEVGNLVGKNKRGGRQCSGSRLG